MSGATGDTPSAPARTGLARIAGLLDDAVLRVEQTFVTLAALVMTTTVTLDIVYRAFATEESTLARKLLTLVSVAGVEKNDANYAILRDYATPFILGLLAFLCGWAAYLAGRRRKGQAASLGIGLAWGAITLVGAWGFVQLVERLSSGWICGGLLILGCLAYAAYALRKRDVIGVVLSAIIAGAGGWLCTHLPPQYIWSQELSLMLLAWMAFLGGSMATRMDKHIQVDALSRLIPKALRPWTRALGLLITTTFCAYMTFLAYEHVFGAQGDYSSGELRPATRIPAWTILLAAVVAFFLMTLRFLGRTIDAFLRPQVPEQKVSH